MNAEVREQLFWLAADWQKYKHGDLGCSNDYASGYEAARNTCGEELKELLEKLR